MFKAILDTYTENSSSKIKMKVKFEFRMHKLVLIDIHEKFRSSEGTKNP